MIFKLKFKILNEIILIFRIGILMIWDVHLNQTKWITKELGYSMIVQSMKKKMNQKVCGIIQGPTELEK